MRSSSEMTGDRRGDRRSDGTICTETDDDGDWGGFSSGPLTKDRGLVLSPPEGASWFALADSLGI